MRKPAEIGTKAAFPGFIERELSKSAADRQSAGCTRSKCAGYRVQIHLKDAAVKVSVAIRSLLSCPRQHRMRLWRGCAGGRVREAAGPTVPFFARDCRRAQFDQSVNIWFRTQPVVSPCAALFGQARGRRRSCQVRPGDVPPFASRRAARARCIPLGFAWRPQRHELAYLDQDYS